MRQFRMGRGCAAIAVGFVIAGGAEADIVGFVPGTYAYNHDAADVGSPPVLGDGFIQLTTGRDQRRSIFFTTPQDITEFTASFTYRAESIGASGNDQGLTFVLQNDAAGSAALGDSLRNLFGPYGLGYQGIAPSAAVTIATNTGPAKTYSGFFSGGILGGGSSETTPVNAFDGNDIRVTLEYAASVLDVQMTDLETGATFERSLLVGTLSSLVGGSTAYVGFTASTGGGASSGGANQFLSDFVFTVPEPASLLSLSVLAAASLRRRTA